MLSDPAPVYDRILRVEVCYLKVKVNLRTSSREAPTAVGTNLACRMLGACLRIVPSMSVQWVIIRTTRYISQLCRGVPVAEFPAIRSWILWPRSIIRERSETSLDPVQLKDDLNIPGGVGTFKGNLGSVEATTCRDGQRKIADVAAETIG